MSRTFAAGSTDPVSGSITAFTTSSWTMGGWFNPASAGGTNIGSMMFHQNGGSPVTRFQIAGTGLNVNAFAFHASTNAQSTSNAAMTANAWNLVIVTYNSSDKKLRIYFGNISTAVAESGSYSLQTAGVGTATTGGTSAYIGDRNTGTFDFDGKIAHCFATNRLLSADEMERFRQGDWLALWDGTTTPNYYVPMDSANGVVDIANQISFTASASYSSENPPTGSPTSAARVTRIPSVGAIPSVTGVGRRTRKRYRPIQWFNVTAAPGADVTVSPGVASVTCTASTPTAQVQPTAGVAAATCSAFAPTAQVTPQPGRAAVTCTASAPTGQVQPTVGVASVTCTASAPTVQVTPQPGVAATTCTASAPAGAPTPTVGRAAVTCTASAPTVQVAPQPGVASVTCTASAPTAQVQPTVGSAATTCAAFDVSVSTNPSVTVNAGSAAATCTAYSPTALVNAIVGLAQATCTAYGPTAQLAVQVAVAAVTCTAHNVTATGQVAEDDPTPYARSYRLDASSTHHLVGAATYRLEGRRTYRE